MTKCIKLFTAKPKAESVDQSQARIIPFRQVPTQIRACDWSMHFAFHFVRNTLTHFVKSSTSFGVNDDEVLRKHGLV